jgi:hypothetical protein
MHWIRSESRCCLNSRRRASCWNGSREELIAENWNGLELSRSNCAQVFAKPFVGALNGPAAGVSCMVKNPRRLNCLVSASLDGGVDDFALVLIVFRVWNSYQNTIIMNFFLFIILLKSFFGLLCADIRLWDVAYR